MTRRRPEDITGTDRTAIEAHLGRHLETLRKHRLARDLIGNDERSGEFGADDFDAFADALSAGVELTRIDRRKIERRAARLAQMRAARLKPLN